MATIEVRRADDGTLSYRAKVRLKGYPAECATFRRKTDATKWAHSIEVAMREGRHFKTGIKPMVNTARFTILLRELHRTD